MPSLRERMDATGVQPYRVTAHFGCRLVAVLADRHQQASPARHRARLAWCCFQPAGRKPGRLWSRSTMATCSASGRRAAANGMTFQSTSLLALRSRRRRDSVSALSQVRSSVKHEAQKASGNRRGPQERPSRQAQSQSQTKALSPRGYISPVAQGKEIKWGYSASTSRCAS